MKRLVIVEKAVSDELNCFVHSRSHVVNYNYTMYFYQEKEAREATKIINERYKKLGWSAKWFYNIIEKYYYVELKRRK